MAGIKVIATNRKAGHEFDLEDRHEVVALLKNIDGRKRSGSGRRASQPIAVQT